MKKTTKETTIKTAKNKNGKLGEDAATEFLVKKGYKIVNRNFRTRFGEIDIIVTNKNYIVFVEVKTRFENSLYKPCEAVDARKQTKIIKTASMYLAENNIDSLQPRFDVIEVTVKRTKEFAVKSIQLIENAFML